MILDEILRQLKIYSHLYDKGDLDQLDGKVKQLKELFLKTLEETYKQKIPNLAEFVITLKEKTVRKTGKKIVKLHAAVQEKLAEQPVLKLPKLKEKKFTSVVMDDLDTVTKCVAIAAVRDDQGATALHWSSLYGAAKVSRYLIPRIAIDERDGDGRTPLHWAARGGQLRQVKILLSAGANLNLVDADDKSAADLAIGSVRDFLMGHPQNQSMRFHAFDDDSTSEEELDRVRNVGIVEMQKKSSSKLSSFLLREFSLRLFVSEEVNRFYYPLKLEQLANRDTLSIELMVEVIQESFKDTCIALDVTLGVKHKSKTDAIIRYFLENKRRFILALYRDKGQEEFSHLFDEIPVNMNPAHICIQDIFREVGMPFSSSKDAKLLIERIPARSPLKKLILESLLNTNTRTEATFLKEHPEFSEETKDKIFLDCFTTRMRLKLATERKKKGAGRRTLDDGFTMQSEQYSLPHFLAYIRLYARSNTRHIKNFMFLGDITEIPRKVVGSFFHFPGIGKMAYETQEVNIKGTKTDWVVTSASYREIYSSLEAIKKKLKVSDEEIARWISLTLEGKAESWLGRLILKPFDKQNLEKSINSLTYLLFFTEVARNPSSLLMHRMMLDLIQNKKMRWKEALVEEKMPMSISGAVAASRGLSRLLNPQTSVARSYDRTLGKEITTPDILMQKEQMLFETWFTWKTGKKKLSLFEKIELLIDQCNQWYGITVESGKVLRDLMVAKDPDHEDEIEGLDEQELGVLKKVYKSGDDERLQGLLDLNEELYELLKLYREDPDKFQALSEQKVLDLIESEYATFSLLSSIFDKNQEKFETLVEDEDDLLLPKYGGNFEEMADDYDDNVSDSVSVTDSYSDEDDFERKKTPYKKMQETWDTYTTSTEESDRSLDGSID